MEIVSSVTEKAVVEERFDLDVDGEVVPGIRWRPEGVAGATATILIGHGGTQHKRAPNVLGLARRFVRHLGVTVLALDAPGHGDRITDLAAAEAARARLESRITERRGAMDLSPEEAKAWADRTRKGVAEWRALVDEVEASGTHNGKFGYWGVSMGTAIGLPFVAAEPRVDAAVLGLAGMGIRPGAADFEAAAKSLTVPVLFLFQWDDELMSRESGLALFDAIGSAQKTMHINPGGHVAMPLFERDAAEEHFRRHLLDAS
jgi:pimeloyl-ACP methyl ester carboxylesterase